MSSTNVRFVMDTVMWGARGAKGDIGSSVNSLNELTVVNHNGTLTVGGTTSSRATSVTVNGTSASLYGDATFAAAGMEITTNYTAVAQDSYGRQDTNAVNVFIPVHANFNYDANGNLLNEWSAVGGTNRIFAYDDENQLVAVWVANAWSNSYAYDGKMRRRLTREYTWQNGAWTETNEIRYIYDGNVVIQERDANNLPVVTYTRGNDLSGTLQGAGGIGGLLARTENSQLVLGQPAQASAFYHADGNGNVTCLINTSNAAVARYEYDPYGNTLSLSGPLAQANKYRFSSKEWDENAGLYYYLYRFYDPNLQRWANRDPYEELGLLAIQYGTFPETLESWEPSEAFAGPDLYIFVVNNSEDAVDSYGLDGTNNPVPPPVVIEPPPKHKPAHDFPYPIPIPFPPRCTISYGTPIWVGRPGKGGPPGFTITIPLG